MEANLGKRDNVDIVFRSERGQRNSAGTDKESSLGDRGFFLSVFTFR